MHHQFNTKNLGQLKYFLGLEISHSKIGISLCQRNYCLNLLFDSWILGSKHASTDTNPSIKLFHDDFPPHMDIPGYIRSIRSLLNLTTTGSDITFITQQISRFLKSHPLLISMLAQECSNTWNKVLLNFSPRDSSLLLIGFSDADWAGCIETRRSNLGKYFFLGKSLISWRTKKQVIVSRSFSEAEYRTLVVNTCDLQWLVYLLAYLKTSPTKPPTFYCDNLSVIHIAGNPVFHERIKHLEIYCFLVREKFQNGLFKLLTISSKAQVVDFSTKPLLSKLGTN